MINTYQTHLISKINLTLDVVLLKFQLDDPKELVFIPGQYMVLFVPTPTGEHLRRLFSIASPVSKEPVFELLAKILPGGAASEYFLTLKENDPILFQGPAGRFLLKETHNNKVFLATGTGLAPIRSMLWTRLMVHRSQFTAQNASPITTYHLLWGVATFEDVYFLEEFKQLAAAYPNFTFKVCLSREQNLDKVPEADRLYFQLGRITQDFAAQLNNTDYYLCGNREVVDSLKTFLLEQKIDNTCVIFEKF